MSLVNVHTHSFYDDLIEPGATILDLGANVGKFAGLMTDGYHCRCVALEPAPNAFDQIPTSASIDRHNVAVSGERGEVVLNLSTNSEANSLGKTADFDYHDAVRVQAVTLADALKLAGADRVALLKLDIEGSEIDVLGGAGPDLLRRFDQITAEFHDFCGITPRPVVRETVRKVRDAGFHVFYFDRDVYRYADVLFVNRRRMSSLRYAVEMARLWGPRVITSAWRRITRRNQAPPMQDSEAA